MDHATRRRLEQFFNATTLRFKMAVNKGNREMAERASTDLAQVMDEMLEFVGSEPLTGPLPSCPDCGQALEVESD